MRWDRSALFVGVQFACLAFLALTGPVVARSRACLLLEGGAVVMGIWAILAMGVGNIGVRPDVREGARFVRRGPYRLIRHPMYTAVLAVTLALAIDRWTAPGWFAWSILLGDLLLKLRYEEALLSDRFPDYMAYRAATKKLIPFLY